MKILKLKFKNINSLKGEHVIDFESNSLKDSGLILISGPTGSGKTTILDVITLALFNRVPRISSPISKSNLTEMGSILTHHTKEASAEVYYSTKGKRYVSKWIINTTRTGNLSDYHMEVFDLETNLPLTQLKSEVPAKNEEIIGLNYEQFVKSILLAQGDFARFLKASHDDRSKLLEKLTGTEVYRELGKAAFDKHKEVEATLKAKEEQRSNLYILSEEEIGNLIEESRVLNINIDKLEKEISQLISLENDLRSFEEASKKNELIEKEIEFVKSRIKKFIDQEIRLKNYDRLDEYREKIQSVQEKNNFLKAEEGNFKAISNEINEISDYLKNLLVKINDIVIGINFTHNNIFDTFSKFEYKIITLNREIEALILKGNDLKNEIEQDIQKLDTGYKEWYQPEIKSDQALLELNKILKDIEGKIQLHGYNLDVRTEDIIKKNQNIDEKLFKLNSLIEVNSIITNLENSIFENEKKLKDASGSIPGLVKVLSELENKKDKLNSDLLKLNKKKEHDLAYLSLEERRAQLVEGEECPLCGSKHHPYVTNVYKIGEVEIEINKINMELDRVKKEYDSTNHELIHSKTLVENLKPIIEKDIKNLKIQKDRQSELLEKDLSLDKIDEARVQLENERKINNDLISSLSQYLKLTPIKNKFNFLFERAKEIKMKRNDFGQLIKEENRFDELKGYFNVYVEKNKDKVEKEGQCNLLKNQIEEQKIKLKEETEKLTIELKSKGFDSIQMAIDSLIDQKELQRLKDEQKNIEDEKARLTNEYKEVQNKLEELSKSITSDLKLFDVINMKNEKIREKDETNKLIGEKNAKIKANEEAENRSKMLVQDIKKLRKELVKWSLLKDCIGDATGKKFAGVAQEFTLNQILSLANKRLENLSDRYLLTSNDKNELNIIDNYLGGIERSVNTLSGGESFILSLALALSLSDLASQNIKLDSLFIDEGFGTLDEDTLNTVISTLEKLEQDSDKTIGIISHVESLKERIITQIHLIKNNQGHSIIRY